MTEENVYTALLAAQASQDWEAEGRLLPLLARTGPKPAHGGTPAERFWSKVAFGVGECWYWTSSIDALGYGRVARVLGETKAHRFAYRLFKGPIPDGLKVMHKCDVRNCVNPDHLTLGTQGDNVRDMMEKGRGVSVAQPGERNGMARLTTAEVTEIRRLVAGGTMQKVAAQAFGVSPMTVSRIIRNEAWR